ncbi:UDP-glucuronic acid decarboxylase family protein [Paenibacillus chartarius]|uniref:UDP-glucuronic acid decarboxylase family protein n=1 Tax=Paenibacillus chartarius TaxID=747481 RepID=A0ABV6DMN9_9BACL
MGARMKIVVTGGAGFLGSFLCERLLASGHDVIALDNLYTGTVDNLKGLTGHPNFTFIQHDVSVPIDLDADQIYHLACPASPKHYQKDPVMTLKTSLLGSLNMLELARARSARILFASTSEVYGDPAVHPQTESYNGNVNVVGPRACYDEGKRAAETLFYEYNRMYQVPVKVVRIFNTYGPRMNKDDGRVVSNFIVQALSGDDITLYGDGSQTRSFCYVTDLIEGIVRMMNSSNSFVGPVNLGNPEEYTVKELAERIIRLTNSRSKIVHRPLPADDPVRRRPDIGLAAAMLNWQPSVKIAEGLQHTIDYFASVLEREK